MALMTDLENSGIGLAGADHVPCAFERVAHHFLAVHMLATLKAEARIRGVHEVGRGDEDGLDRGLLVEHLLDVFVDLHFTLDLVLVLTKKAAAGLGDGKLPDVAHGHPLDAGHVLGGDPEGISLGTAADEGALDRAPGGGFLCHGGLAGHKVEAAAGQGAGAEKAAPVHET